MSKYNDRAANRSKKRVYKAGRSSACRIEQKVFAYVEQGYNAMQVADLMKDNHNTPVVISWVESLTGES